MKSYKEFADSIAVEGTARAIRAFGKRIGDFNFETCTQKDLEELIINARPQNERELDRFVYSVELYARFNEDAELFNKTKTIDRTALWQRAKHNIPAKFLSHKDYLQLLEDMERLEEYNVDYKVLMMKSVYEGVYNDDLSVIKNLKASDINENILTLRPDNGEPYELSVSLKLANELKEFSKVQIFERKNSRCEFTVPATGVSHDACFKFELRKDKTLEELFRFSVYRVLRDATKKYCGRSILPSQIYISGIVYRIKIKLQEKGLTMEDAFGDMRTHKAASDVVKAELARSHYDVTFHAFKHTVKSHYKIFD